MFVLIRLNNYLQQSLEISIYYAWYQIHDSMNHHKQFYHWNISDLICQAVAIGVKDTKCGCKTYLIVGIPYSLPLLLPYFNAHHRCKWYIQVSLVFISLVYCFDAGFDWILCFHVLLSVVGVEASLIDTRLKNMQELLDSLPKIRQDCTIIISNAN